MPIIGQISVGDGATFTPDVDNDGVLSWTNNKNLTNPASVDIPQAVVDRYQLAPINSPAFTGTPTAPTPSAADDSTQIATTEFVNDKADGYLPLSGGTMTGEGTIKYSGANNRTAQILLDNGAANFDVGWDFNNVDGAIIGLRGVEYSNPSTDAGAFVISARKGNDTSSLVGYPAGGLFWKGVSLTNGTFLAVRSVSTPTITASTANGIEVTAPTVSGYQFLCWYLSVSIGAVYTTNIANSTSVTCKIWWNGSAPVGTHIDAFALYVRKW